MTYGGSLPDWYTFFKENRGVLPMYLIFSSLAFFGNKKDAYREPVIIYTFVLFVKSCLFRK